MESSMNRGLMLLGGICLGVGLMYVLDPDRGRARRALARDKMGSLVLHTNTTVGKTARHLGNQTRGMVAETRRRMRRDNISDQELADRVRSALGELVPDPRTLHINVQNGRVSLSGPVLLSQVQSLVEQTAMIPGVVGVNNRLTVYQNPADVPAPQ